MKVGQGRSESDAVEADESGLDALLKEVARLPDVAPGIVGARLAGRFVVRRRLGQGGMGVVFEAFDEQRGETVALKTLERLDGAAVYRMKNEFRALANLVHPNLVRLHELFSDGERWFFTMARVEGVPFLQHVRRGAAPEERRVDPLDATDPMASGITATSAVPERALRGALAGLATGVRALHRAGKLHRDLKPSNVLVDPEGHVTILDFGLVSPAKEADRSRDLASAGTPAYMAPEQLDGAAVPASDWYSVGAMLYEALSGRLPFVGSAARILADKQLGRAPAPLREVAPDAPADLADLAMALLHARSEERPGEDEIHARLGASSEGAWPVAEQASPFVGRDAELGRLRRAFATVRGGAPAIVYVAGVSGIGKTALCERFLDEVHGEAEVLSGRCYEREAVPFKALDAIVDALSRRLRDAGAVAAARLTPRSTTELCRIFPVLERVPAFAEAAGASAASDPQEVRRRAFLGLKETFARLGEARPVVLFIDDLQWGDVDSAAFLTELASPPEPPRVLLIGSYRSDEVERSPLLRILRDHTKRALELHAETLSLEPLEASAATALATALLGDADDEERARALAAEAGGNPFFLAQLARASTGGSAAGTTLAEVVGREVRALPADARVLLEVVAVASGPVRCDVALGAAGLAPMHDEAVLHLVRAALLRSSGPGPSNALETYHDRIRETVAAALSPDRARHHHRALAEALGKLPEPPAARLAFHWHEAGERAPASAWALRAAKVAEEALAFDRAAELYERALDLSMGDDDPAERRQIERSLGEALASAGRGTDAARVFRRATVGAPEVEAFELERRATYEILHTGDLEHGAAAARALLGRTGVWLPRSSLVQGLLVVASLLYWRWRGFLGDGRGKPLDDPRLLQKIDIFATVAVPTAMSDTQLCAYLMMRALWWARRAGEPERLGALAMAMYAALVSFDPRAPRSSPELDEIRRYVDAHPGPVASGSLGFSEVIIACNSGDFGATARLSSEAERIYERSSGTSAQLTFARAYRVWSLFYLGELRQVTSLALAQARWARERGNWWMQCAMQGFPMVITHLSADRADLATREMAEALSRWSDTVPVLRSWYVLGRSLVNLYEGRAADLRPWLRHTWPSLRRSGVMRVAFGAVLLLDVCCRVTLAAASSEPDPHAAKTLARAADRNAKKLGALGTAHAPPLAALAHAGAAHLLGAPERSVLLLEEAIRGLDAIGMQLHAACARRRLGALRGGAEGEALIAEGDRFMREQTIVRPDRFTAMLAPGFPE